MPQFSPTLLSMTGAAIYSEEHPICPDTDALMVQDGAGVPMVADPPCINCGDCVRMCKEVQGIGVLDFVGRGSGVQVSPAFGKSLSEVECVYCGQCATCCPTGALTVKSEADKVWKKIYDPDKVVVAQIAPAVRTAVGEAFGVTDPELAMGKTVAALRRMGFDRVYPPESDVRTAIEDLKADLDKKRAGRP